ncbi:unnamed protein product [Nesidiocoris tenuis]|uniref:NADH-ubiquinone oxidoreductase 49 kDa subunit n=1 Tax=Nesidiocoris tenuis TaxID=355587 RepID=A0A6H5GDE2_9HEMI|nr:unnamed protein product [Nesidiocoris tenuis]
MDFEKVRQTIIRIHQRGGASETMGLLERHHMNVKKDDHNTSIYSVNMEYDFAAIERAERLIVTNFIEQCNCTSFVVVEHSIYVSMQKLGSEGLPFEEFPPSSTSRKKRRLTKRSIIWNVRFGQFRDLESGGNGLEKYSPWRNTAAAITDSFGRRRHAVVVVLFVVVGITLTMYTVVVGLEVFPFVGIVVEGVEPLLRRTFRRVLGDFVELGPIPFFQIVPERFVRRCRAVSLGEQFEDVVLDVFRRPFLLGSTLTVNRVIVDVAEDDFAREVLQRLFSSASEFSLNLSHRPCWSAGAIHPDRCAGRWYPDTESLKQIGGVVMYPDPSTGSAPIPVNRVYTPEGEVLEKNVRNVMLNFGPQHPAAHGVLRLVLELDAEVCSTGDFLPARIGNTLKIAAGVS